jgi:F-type H+-transporting ATPase subunit a
MSADSIHISLTPEPIANLTLPLLGPINLTNSMFSTIIVTILMCIFAVVAGGLLKKEGKPSKLQNFIEWFYEFVEGLSGDNLGSISKARKYIGLSITLFLFILLGSWFGLLPGVMQLTTYSEGLRVPLLRAPTTDLNFTIALSLIAFLVIQYSGFAALGFGYLSKFFTFKGGAMGFAVGILELVSELSRLLSFSFRLFGNIFAGEVLLVILFYFTKSIWFPAPTLVILMETFVALIQSYVFVSLMSLFISLATTAHDEH